MRVVEIGLVKGDPAKCTGSLPVNTIQCVDNHLTDHMCGSWGIKQTIQMDLMGLEYAY